ncbi:unnamed protein product [Darwinula stevensoni]|uniref:Olfactomedin-like domain-containing protein n=1 Tax=Darwinula stevensoni TaxID=69355 RepID=A0A7R9A9L0_9CRUS|nr:unnamed protein product [Darwinula stevensoni]CAG0897470.1 unnamed protein product [Darwinula stevensoni]
MEDKESDYRTAKKALWQTVRRLRQGRQHTPWVETGRFGWDLYNSVQLSDLELPFTNPYIDTTMLTYNPRTKKLLSWDNGYQLKYPVKQSSLGLGVDEDERKDDPMNEVFESAVGNVSFVP